MNSPVASDTVADPDLQLLIDLVSTPSVSGCERDAALRFVQHARVRGFDAQVDEAGNAVAHRGRSDAPIHIIMLGHIDTVPGDIPVRISDGVLHGRGAVDAKGPLCAMLCAAERAELPADTRVSVIGAVGEESAGSPGARYLAPRMRPDACVIGEPSGWDGITLGYKGRLLATATASCAHHHSAAEDASAGDEAAGWWSRVLSRVEEFNADQQGVFDTIQATILGMHTDCDGLTQQATLETGFRLPVGIHPGDFSRMIEALAGEDLQIDCTGAEHAHVTDRNDPVVRALSSAIRSVGGRPRPKRKTGTADLNVVGPVWACPIAAYGPGDSSLDHTPFERIELDEFRRSIQVLTQATSMLAAELASAHEPSSTSAT
ncbi:MAG: [LysW]-lysine hydrolase [Planctomycetota bacterium]